MKDEVDSSMIGPAEASLFRSSDQIRADVEELISLSDMVQPKNIRVSVEDGEVTLQGRVINRNAFEAAGRAAREVLGVTAVHNCLEIAE